MKPLGTPVWREFPEKNERVSRSTGPLAPWLAQWQGALSSPVQKELGCLPCALPAVVSP